MPFNFIKESVSIVRLPKPQKLATNNPFEGVPKAGDICSVVGWGSTRSALTVEDLNEPKYPSERLQKAEVSIWNYDKCVQTYENARSQNQAFRNYLRFSYVYNRNICANSRISKRLGRGTCKVTK